MTTCEKHGCALKELLTSTYCPRCDEEAAVNAAQGPEVVAVGSGSMVGQDGKVIRYRVVGTQSPGSPDTGWYHNYPVCGTDANGSDVHDMDVCMGLHEWMAPNWHGPGSVDFSAMEPRYRRLFLKRNPDARSHYREWRDGCARAALKALQGR